MLLQRSEGSTEPAAGDAGRGSSPPPADPDDIVLQTDISQWLVLKAPSKDGPEVRGGHPDALVVLATKATKGMLLYCVYCGDLGFAGRGIAKAAFRT